jgi:hypothetical protein
MLEDSENKIDGRMLVEFGFERLKKLSDLALENR